MEKSSAQERQRATDIGTDHSGDHVDEGNSLVTVLTSSDVNNLTSSNTSVSRGHEKGFLQGVLVSLPLASAAAVLGAGGLAAILCITQTICPTTETQQVIEVRTSGDVVFRNLPRPPTQVEIAGVVEQIQNFFEILIARELGAVEKTATLLATAPTTFISYDVISYSETLDNFTVASSSSVQGEGDLSVFCNQTLRVNGNSSIMVEDGHEVSQNIIDLTTQNPNLTDFCLNYVANAQPPDSIYRNISCTELNIDFTSTTTEVPSSSPTLSPSTSPSFSSEPSTQPSTKPSISAQPSASASPTLSAQPSSSSPPSASAQPTLSASPSLSAQPTLSALPSLSIAPSALAQPTMSAHPSLSTAPSASSQPTLSALPSLSTAPSASSQPSLVAEPSTSLSPSLSLQPSLSAAPSGLSEMPSTKPSNSIVPSTQPSNSMLSLEPSTSMRPSIQPSLSESPTQQPSLVPSTQPSGSGQPSLSSAPSMQPSGSAAPSTSSVPSMQPSGSANPSVSLAPSWGPSNSPSRASGGRLAAPSSSEPSLPSSSGPSSQPSKAPTTLQPSKAPATSPPSKAPSTAPTGESFNFDDAPDPFLLLNHITATTTNPSDNPSSQPSQSPTRLARQSASGISTLEDRENFVFEDSSDEESFFWNDP
ncbi:unknown protein [Seminavis robusta]|uniref:Uncharacterized protein n=1 Tax=Seminavis robusta TaxID=568900 RepID=A0A9N8HK63_9STRA|nr:unknown protein [Seminavis robusta]|eukprot:Sro917_g219850.1 n/a (648) ;mRNA; f:3163-5442